MNQRGMDCEDVRLMKLVFLNSLLLQLSKSIYMYNVLNKEQEHQPMTKIYIRTKEVGKLKKKGFGRKSALKYDQFISQYKYFSYTSKLNRTGIGIMKRYTFLKQMA
jgi:hypothetical protein